DLQAVPGDGRSVTDQRAPLFQLPSADGSEIALVDCLAQGPTIVWFSRGLSCSFCRRHRVQLTLNYPAFRHLGAEILEVTPTPVNLATFYLSRYQLAFPYLCDPRGVVAEMYGVKRGTYEPLMALRVMLADTLGSKEIMREYLHGPKLEPTAEEMANGGSNEGFFIVDRSGTVRLATVGPHIGVPSNDEVERQLRRIIG
ncbi:MAG: redoxin domain-containing protein, partial [Candidatus Tectomicrobia bacterium]|nr:redoxin domain-containing protein [Candidatus Tectomicrobia bacterium]